MNHALPSPFFYQKEKNSNFDNYFGAFSFLEAKRLINIFHILNPVLLTFLTWHDTCFHKSIVSEL